MEESRYILELRCRMHGDLWHVKQSGLTLTGLIYVGL